MRARIADVGLARHEAQGASMTGGVGTFAYIDPEYFESGMYLPASDVFSFGVGILELLTGLPAIDPLKQPPKLYSRVRPRLPLETEALSDSSAGWSTLRGGTAAQEFTIIGTQCTAAESICRPQMAQVKLFQNPVIFLPFYCSFGMVSF